jgi:hypothetical protein
MAALAQGATHDLLLRRGRRELCRFSDAGMPSLSTRSGGRRPKSAKARNRGGWGTAVPRALWGIERGAGLKENDAKRSSPWLWPKAWVSLQG